MLPNYFTLKFDLSLINIIRKMGLFDMGEMLFLNVRLKVVLT